MYNIYNSCFREIIEPLDIYICFGFGLSTNPLGRYTFKWKTTCHCFMWMELKFYSQRSTLSVGGQLILVFLESLISHTSVGNHLKCLNA